MTEPAVASSDATNIESSIVRDGDEYVVNGRKWYTTNATDPRCEIIIFMGKSDPDNPDRHRQQSMILVPKDTPGVEVMRPLPVFNFYGMPDRASEVQFTDVRVPATNMLLGEGRGFEIAQGRLGPGRIHHCMRLIGLAERALEMMCRRTQHRVTFGRPVAEQTVTLERIAEARIAIEQTRLLTLKTAHLMDTVGQQGGAARDRDDQDRRAEHGVQGRRLGDPGLRRRRNEQRLRAGRRRTPPPASSGSPTGPTRFTATSSGGSSCAGTPTRPRSKRTTCSPRTGIEESSPRHRVRSRTSSDARRRLGEHVRQPVVPRTSGLELRRQPEQGGLVTEAAEEVHADRQTRVVPAQRDRHRRVARDVGEHAGVGDRRCAALERPAAARPAST